MLERETPKIATSGQLMIGVNIVPPINQGVSQLDFDATQAGNLYCNI